MSEGKEEGTYALIQGTLVVNIVVWDGDTENWKPDDGIIAIEIPKGETVGIGWTYENGYFSAPETPEEE